MKIIDITDTIDNVHIIGIVDFIDMGTSISIFDMVNIIDISDTIEIIGIIDMNIVDIINTVARIGNIDIFDIIDMVDIVDISDTAASILHSLSAATHDVGQQHAEDDGDDQRHDNRHQVVWEQVPAGGGLREGKVSACLQNPRPHGGGRWSQRLLGQVKLQRKKVLVEVVSRGLGGSLGALEGCWKSLGVL